MKKRGAKLYIRDILDSIEKIEKYTKGLTFSQFANREIVLPRRSGYQL